MRSRFGRSFRAKLLATYLLLAALIGGSVLYAVDRRLGDDLVAALDNRLEAQAQAVAGWLSRSGNPHRLAKRLARVVDARVSVMDAEGRLVGDSLVRDELPSADPEGDSRSFRAAHAGRVGRETRFSPLAGEDMYFVAVPTREGGAIRLAVPIADIDATRRGLRNQLALIALVGFLGAVAIGVLATRTLVRERDLLSNVMTSLVEGVAVVDKGAVIIDNQSARAILHTGPGQTLADAELRQLVARAIAERKPQEAEVNLRDRTLLASAQPLEHGDDAAVVVLYDVTSLRRLESVRRDFVANLTHELRTPVTSIRGYSETLVDSVVDDATRTEFLDTIQRNAMRIGRLVDDLLILSELDARPDKQAGQHRVDVASVCASVASTAQPQAEAAGVDLEVDVAPGLAVRGDADSLEQIVQNLVDNAIKYGAAGNTVRIEAVRRGEQIVIVVQDNGVGIPIEHHARLFERFYRVDPGRSRQQGGTGLGLAIVKHLTEGMAGTVRIDSETEVGCRFVVTLPADQTSASSANT